MSQYYSSLKKRLEQDNTINETEITEMEDSVLRKDIDKLRNLWKSVKENRSTLDNVLDFDDNSMLRSEGKKSQVPKELMESMDDKVSFDITTQDPQNNEHTPDISRTVNISNFVDEYQNNSLKEKLRLAEEKIAKMQKLQDTYVGKLASAEEELEECHAKIAKQAYLNQVQSIEIDDVNQKYRSVSVINSADADKLREELEIARSALIDKQYRCDRLESILKERDEQIIKLSNLKSLRFSEEIDLLLEENQNLRKQLEKSEKSLDDLYVMRRSEGATLLELERQKEDVKRLLTLLQSTEEFKEFSSITGVEKIRFLPKAKQGSLQRRTHQAAYDSIKKEAQQEKTMWVPLEAFQFAHDFRMQFQGELTEELTDNLLYELNKIWRAKEESELKKQKEKFEKEKYEIKRQISQKFSYNQLTAKKEIDRLKTLHRKKSPTFAGSRDKTQIPLEVNLLNDTVKNAVHSYKVVKTVEKENRELSNRVKTLEERDITVDEKKTIFLDGAKWMLSTFSSDFDLVIDQTAKLHQDYQLTDPNDVAIENIMEEYNIASKKMYLIRDGMDTIFSNMFGKIKRYSDKVKIMLQDSKFLPGTSYKSS